MSEFSSIFYTLLNCKALSLGEAIEIYLLIPSMTVECQLVASQYTTQRTDKATFPHSNASFYHPEQPFLLHTQQNSHDLHGSAYLCGYYKLE